MYTESGEEMDLCPRTGRRKRSGKTGRKAQKKDKDECHDADDIEKLFVGTSESLPKIDDIPEKLLTQPITNTSLSLCKMPVPTSSFSSPVTSSKPVQPPMEHVAEDDDKDPLLAKGRHDIRRLVGRLQEETKLAGRLEAERRERVKKQRDKVTIAIATCAIAGIGLQLDVFGDEKNNRVIRKRL